MTNMNLLELFGAADGTYVLEAQRLRSGEKNLSKPGGKHSSRRLWLLIAAIITALALSIPTYAAIRARIRMHLTQNTAPTEVASQITDLLLTHYPQSLPEGYSPLCGDQTDGQSRSIIYQNTAGETIVFSLSTQHDYLDIPLKPPVEEEALTISGHSAVLFTTAGGGRLLTWKNENDGYNAALLTEDTKADIVAMAESVAPGEPLPLSFQYEQGEPWDFWYPQSLPEGYQPTDVSRVFQGVRTILYSDDKGRVIQYSISTTRDLSDISPTPHSELRWEDVEISGVPGKRLVKGDSQQLLFWKNEEADFNAMLMTQNMEVNLIPIAESVAHGEQLEVFSSHKRPDHTIELEQQDSGYVQWEPMYPQTLPAGYQLTFVSDKAYGEQMFRYEASDGHTIQYVLMYRMNRSGREFSGMGQPEQVDINGHVGYLSTDEFGVQGLIWTDEERGFGFRLSSMAGVDLVAIARSVAPGPEIPPTNADKTLEALEQLGDYQITALPEGMVEDGLAGMPQENPDDWYSYVRRWYFHHQTNQEIFLEYSAYITEDTATATDVALMEAGGADRGAQAVTVNGCPGAMRETDSDATVVWVIGDNVKGVAFTLYSTNFSGEELLTIAQSVERQ